MMLNVQDLHAYYGKSHILQGVDMHIDAGEVVSLLGRNGVGRSTTVKAIMGEVAPQGSIKFKGSDIAGLPSYRIAHLGLGYVPEHRDIFPGLTVRQNLMLGIKDTRRAGKWRLEDMLEMFPNLKARADPDLPDARQRTTGNTNRNREAWAARVELRLDSEVLVEGAFRLGCLDDAAHDHIASVDELNGERNRPSRLLSQRVNVPAVRDVGLKRDRHRASGSDFERRAASNHAPMHRSNRKRASLGRPHRDGSAGGTDTSGLLIRCRNERDKKQVCELVHLNMNISPGGAIPA